MASDFSKVKSSALTELKTDLTNLSATLHELYELMNADMSQVNKFWKDPKYEEFVSGYKPQILKCEEISIRYDEWCKRILDPLIEKVIKIETSDVTGNGSGGGGGAIPGGSGGAIPGGSGGGSTGGDSNRPLSPAEKMARFKKGNEFMKNKIAESTPGPQGSGFATPQNERPRLSPLQLKILRDGKER